MSRDWWTAERVARLRAMAESGMSSNAMSSELQCTRNAALGKCAREHIPLLAPQQGGVQHKKSRPGDTRRSHKVGAYIPPAGPVTLPLLPSLSVPLPVLCEDPE